MPSPAHGLEALGDSLDDQRRQALARLVEHEQPGAGEHRAGDGEHLALAAGERAGTGVAELARAWGTCGRRPRSSSEAPPFVPPRTSSRFSFTVRFGKAREPDGTSERPLRTRLKDGRCEMSSPASRSARAWLVTTPAIAISAVVLPAPLRPSTATPRRRPTVQIEVEDHLALPVERVEPLDLERPASRSCRPCLALIRARPPPR